VDKLTPGLLFLRDTASAYHMSAPRLLWTLFRREFLGHSVRSLFPVPTELS